MKWIGALLFISISTWLGFQWSNTLNKRPTHIIQLKNALQILEAEMLYSQLPLLEAFIVISHQIPTPMNSFFHQLGKEFDEQNDGFNEHWASSVDTLMENSSLSNNEREILIQFGKTLGQHDFIQQQKHILLATTHLDRELDDARDKQLRYGKMAKNIGFLFGLFIVLLLI